MGICEDMTVPYTTHMGDMALSCKDLLFQSAVGLQASARLTDAAKRTIGKVNPAILEFIKSVGTNKIEKTGITFRITIGNIRHQKLNARFKQLLSTRNERLQDLFDYTGPVDVLIAVFQVFFISKVPNHMISTS